MVACKLKPRFRKRNVRLPEGSFRHQPMKLLKPSLLVLMLLGLPLAGVWMAGRDVSAYLEFPPYTQYVDPALFSWPVFIGLSIVVLAVMLPFLFRVLKNNLPGKMQPHLDRALSVLIENGFV